MVEVCIYKIRDGKETSFVFAECNEDGEPMVWGGRPEFDLNGFVVDVDVHIRGQIQARALSDDAQFHAHISFVPPRAGILYPGNDCRKLVWYIQLSQAEQERVYHLLFDRAQGMMRFSAGMR